MLIQENIAYDTKGHCLLLEDGIEKNNRFIRNLGAQTGIPEKGIPDFGPNGLETVRTLTRDTCEWGALTANFFLFLFRIFGHLRFGSPRQPTPG